MTITEKQKMICHSIIHTASSASAAIGGGLAQVPLSDSAVITPIQVAMIVSLGTVFGLKISETTAHTVFYESTAGMIGRSISQLLIGWMPGLGNAINALTAGGITEIIGWNAVSIFENMVDQKSK